MFGSQSQPFWISVSILYNLWILRVFSSSPSPLLFREKSHGSWKEKKASTSKALRFSLTSVGTKLWNLTMIFLKKWQKEVTVNWRERCVFLETILDHYIGGATPSVAAGSPIAWIQLDMALLCIWPVEMDTSSPEQTNCWPVCSWTPQSLNPV